MFLKLDVIKVVNFRITFKDLYGACCHGNNIVITPARAYLVGRFDCL